MPAGSSHLDAGNIAPGERYRCNPWVGNEFSGLGPWDENGFQDAPGQSRLLQDAFDLKGNTRNVGGVFKHGGITRHQRGSGEAEDLPVGEVPGHDR